MPSNNIGRQLSVAVVRDSCTSAAGQNHSVYSKYVHVSHGCCFPIARTFKVMGYKFNFARAIINLYTKHWAVSAENFGVSFRGVKTLCDRIYGLF